MKGEPILKAEHICVVFEGKKVVDNVSFTVDRGDYLCIVGENGAGKSSLVRAMLGLCPTSCGKAEFLLKTKRKRIGYLPQQTEAQKNFPATVRETVLSGCLSGMKFPKFYGKEEFSRAEDFMRYLDILPLQSKPVRELSGGQRQRVFLARALCATDEILVLDEPAAGLDPRGRERILGMLQELHREGGVTIVMVSHSMDDCARLATRMIVMSKGELVLTDTPRNVFRQADLMRSIGLGVPEAAELCGRLRAAGLQLPDDLFTQEELHDHLLRLWKEKQEKEAAK